MFKKSVLAIMFAGMCSIGAQAAEGDECGCTTSRINTGNGIGSVISSTGDVFMSSKNGFGAVTVGDAIPQNAEIIVGCEASAQIKVGQACDLLLSSGSEVTVVATGEKLCVRAAQTSKNCGITGSTEGSGTLSSTKSQVGGNGGFGLPEALFGGTAAVWGSGFLWEDDDTPPPASP